MIPLVAAALGADPALRAAGEAAEARADWPAALAAWEACVADAPDRDAAYCRTKRDTLAPQAADGFAGWAALEAVRRDYRTLGSDDALARIEAALAANPAGPAAPALRLWLLNEHNRRGDADAVARLRAELAADARTPASARRFADGLATRERDAARHRTFGLAGGALAAVFVVTALVRGGPWKWRSALLAGAALGAIPTVFAALYEENVADGFARAGLVVSACVLLAARAPVWVAVPGTLGAFAAVAWQNGWYPSLGL